MHPIQTLSSLACLALLAACSTPEGTVVFVTKTSVGIDAEQATPGVSIAYDRFEGYLAPRYGDSNIPPVYATFKSNGEVISRDIRHVYATGSAAKQLAQNQMVLQSAAPGSPVAESDFRAKTQALAFSQDKERAPVQKELAKAMYFGTTTTLGIKFGFSGTGVDNFVFGFKRKEISIIPQGANTAEFPSVVALYKNDLKHEHDASGNQVQLAIGQLIATGAAADALANNLDVNRQVDLQTRGILAPETPTSRISANDDGITPIAQAELKPVR